MLSFQEFFKACAGFWTTERTYHLMLQKQIERSYTEFQVDALTLAQKQQILAPSQASGAGTGINFDLAQLMDDSERWPGFAIAFDTQSETGETVAMSLKALFIPDTYVTSHAPVAPPPALPLAAQVAPAPEGEIIQGFYLRDQGYSEAGAIAGRFTYQITRQTLEMTTYYKRSVAVDQMRLITPDLRLRTIVTYQRPQSSTIEGEDQSNPEVNSSEPPSVITLIGFGVEHKRATSKA
ncbi:MAG: phycobiliprotein lyase [Leptolyngbyaceae bacterium]|nr:phycobiliprotein lyase [Leptolyngbyaceae bacterium]